MQERTWFCLTNFFLYSLSLPTFLKFFSGRCFMFKSTRCKSGGGLTPWLQTWLSCSKDEGVINAKKDITLNNWLQKFWKFLEKRLWWSLFYLSCKPGVQRTQLYYKQTSQHIIFGILLKTNCLKNNILRKKLFYVLTKLRPWIMQPAILPKQSSR